MSESFSSKDTSAQSESVHSDPIKISEAVQSSEPKPNKSKKALGLRIAIACGVLVVAFIAVYAGVVFVGVSFTAKEGEVRSDWSVETGELIESQEDLGISVYEASVDSSLRVIQLIPEEYEEESFTYYDEEVQGRIASAIAEAKETSTWTADNPLAILNPFGTGSNGLYLYFTTTFATQVTYTISVDDDSISDYAVTAKNTFLDSDELDVTENAQSETEAELSREHEFQIVGLVPGMTNHVTLTIYGSQGNVRQEMTFDITMPDTQSGYPTQLEVTDGASDEELSDGLFVLVRTNGYLGYAFFFDNDGVMRYEMVTEGLGLDRILEYGDDIVVCSSAYGLARINGLGRVVANYDLDGYVLHHDINYGGEGIVIALAEHENSEFVEDVVIEVDLATGEVTELVDFTELMSDFVDEYTHIIGPTDPFFWQVGEYDWIHLNTVDYDEETDAIIVSSRETSTIMKVSDVHSDPELVYFIGDESYWEGTAYENLCLEQTGDFKFQYGQHTVEFDGEGEEDGTYYLLLFDNNYWANSTRSDYEPDLDGTDVSTDLYSGTTSYVYRYLVNEEAGTYELVALFAVPYSSIVSNVAHAPSSDNYIVNSGVANVYGEYDANGELIREYAYECTLQSYRTYKDDFIGFWYETPIS